MTLENQVCSLELAKRLKELGVKQESYFVWYLELESNECKITDNQDMKNNDWEWCSAFTVAELGEMLPICYYTVKLEGGWSAMWNNGTPDYLQWKERICGEKTEADARAKMLIYLIENKTL